MNVRAPKRALTGGEVDPDLWYASDLNPVRTGASKVRNFIVRQKGGVERRPGTEFLAASSAVERVRLAPFIRSAGSAYLVEWTPLQATVYDSEMAYGDGIVDAIVTPYTLTDLPYLQFSQSNDVQWLFSGKPVKELVRSVDPVTFELVDAAIENGPFLDANTKLGRTITAVATQGATTLTASAPIFTAENVGAFYRLEEPYDTNTPLWDVGKAVALNDQRRFNGNTYVCTAAGTTSAYPPEHEAGEQDDGGDVRWKYIHSGFGIVKITGYTSPTEVSCDVIKRLPASIRDMGTFRWSEGAWSDRRGYPICGAIYKNALWAGGSEHEPFMLWKSAIDGFNDWEPGTFDDSAMNRALVDGQTESVRWMVPSKVLAIGTDGPEWIARPETSGDTVRVNNLITEPATGEGTSAVPGIAVGVVTVFPDASRRRLTSMDYDFRRERWAPGDLSLLAGHMLGPGILEMHYQRTPWPIFWCLLANGTVAACTYLPDQDVIAWHRHNFGDPVESLCVLPVDGGEREAVFLAVRRNGVACIERMFDHFRCNEGHTIADARYLDAARQYDLEVPAATFSGLDHLEGRNVVALVDGNSHPPVLVTGGEVTLNFAGSNVVIGLPFLSRYATLPFDFGMPDEDQASRPKRVSDIAMAFRATMGGDVMLNGREQRVFPLGDTALDAPPELYTGMKPIFPPGSSDDCVIEYRTATAWPATITAIYPEYEV